MADRSVYVRLKADVGDYMAKFSAAGKAASELAGKVDNATGKQKQGFDMIGRSALVMGGAAVAGFGFAVKASMDFDRQMSQLQAASGATSASMKDLRAAAIQAGADTVFSASEAAEAETALAKAGVSTADILGGALTGAVNLAAAGQIDLGQAAELSAIAMKQFGLAGRDVSHVADLLAAAAGKSVGEVSDIGMALKQSALVAHQTGLSIEETVGALADFASQGLIGSDAGTSFKTMLQRLNPQSAEAAQLMDRLNLSAYDSQGNFIGLAAYAGKLQGALGNMSAETRQAAMNTLFGADAVRAASVLYDEGAEGVKKWTDAVNDQGYAQAFAAIALDNLSGDLEQLKGSIETALIQSGGKANGILREMVQDVTAVVNIYNDLPGPIQAAATGIVAVGGAVTLAGGAALMFIPKWTAMNAALVASGRSAITARGAIGMLGKGLGVGAGLFAAYEGVTALKGALDGSVPSVEKFTSSLTQMGAEGGVAGDSLLQVLRTIVNLPFGLAGDYVSNLDQALSGLVTSGKADLAADDFERIRSTLESAGMSVEQITALFPDYAGALRDSAAQAKLAGNGVDDYGNAVGDAAEATKQATDALQDYTDHLHALADPLFGMNKAVTSLKDAQDAYNKAVKEHGARSKEARQALLDQASAALDLKVASADLATAVATGTVSMAEAKAQLHEWADQGLITDRQAKNLIDTFRGLIGRAKDLSDVDPTVTVKANLSDLDRIDQWLASHRGMTVPLTVQPSTGQVIPHGLAGGGPVVGPGTGTSDDVWKRLSNGEFVVTADGSNLGDALRFYGYTATSPRGGDGASAGSGSKVSITINDVPAEKVAGSIPQALREAAYVSGNAW